MAVSLCLVDLLQPQMLVEQPILASSLYGNQYTQTLAKLLP
jgi:hypothetical protein